MRRWLVLINIIIGLVSGSMAAPNGTIRQKFPSPGSCPTGLTFAGKQLWLSDRKSDTIYALDSGTGQVTHTIPAPGYWPLDLAFDGTYLWNVDAEDKKIYQIEPKTGLILRAIEAPTSQIRGLTWDGKNLWLADEGEDKILQISPEDGTTIISFKAPSESPQGLAFDGRYLWVSDRIKDEIYAVTPDQGQVILTLPAPGKYARGLAWDGQQLWCVDYQADSLYALEVQSPEFIRLNKFRRAKVELTHQFRNYGPGLIKNFEVYFAVPQNRPGQKILSPVQFSATQKVQRYDQWGQEIAHFHYADVAPAQVVSTCMTVAVEIAEIRYDIRPEKVGPLEQIPQELKNRYLRDDVKFQLKHPVIQAAVQEAIGSEKNPYWIARKAYQYLMEKMFYELSGGWNIAPTVLSRGNGSCSEYSFVYIAMCRAAGLPARYVGSVVVRGDDASTDDVFHRWVEVYLPNYGWIPVDPSSGDQIWPEAQASYFGHLANRFLITTEGGGGSEYLGWNYNSFESWSAEPKCKIHIESVAEWEPLPGPDGN